MTIKQLAIKANTIRIDVIKMLAEAGSGHTAGALGTADIFTALYFSVLRYDPKRPKWEDRDRFVLSCGHINPILYATMAHAGYFPLSELKTLRKFHTRLQGHPHNLALPGIETSSGPLGQGLSQAIGIALAGRLDKKNYRVYAFLSDGEHDEGQTWEAVMFAAKYRLSNLVAILDRNHIQIDGTTEDVMPLTSVAERYRAFGWRVIEIDGNNIQAVLDACHEAEAIAEQPVLIIARTVPGKGVSFIEGDYHWHGKAPTPEEAKRAIRELQAVERRIR